MNPASTYILAAKGTRRAPAATTGNDSPVSSLSTWVRSNRWLLAVALGTTGLLVATAGGYGYSRDELYFLAAGRHLAWGYPDQPPLTPLVARLMSTIAPDSLVVLRLPSAVIAGVVVLLTGRIARVLGAGPAAQVGAAACMAAAGGTLAITHTLGTSALDLMFWTILTLLVLRVLDGGDRRWWLAVGAVLGVALENKSLVAFLAVAVLLGLAVNGPRSHLRSPSLWCGAAVAVVMWLPNLLWQAGHGWPQLDLASAIANGGSTSSTPWYLFVPLELLFMCPVLVPVWGAGLARLLGAGAGMCSLRRFGCFGWAYALLALIFLLTGGKQYYLVGLYPVLFAAGAEPALDWARRGTRRVRRAAPPLVLGIALVVDAVISLPLLPVAGLAASPVTAVNPDAAETVGWPAFTGEVAQAYRSVPHPAVLLMGNYGEAGAVDRLGPAYGLPGAVSGHNGYGLWGPPRADAGTSAIAVGFDKAQLQQWFSSVQPRGVIANGHSLDNDEEGRTIWWCTGRRHSWDALWSSIRRLG